MIDNSIKDYIRLIGSISLTQNEKDHITKFLVEKSAERKEISGKYVAVASAVAFLAVGTYILARNAKQNINIM